VWMDSAAVDLLHSVRIKKNSWCEVVYVRYDSSVYGAYVEVYLLVGACYLVPLSGGICRGVYLADVFSVRCWSVLASVFAASLFFLYKVSLYVFLSGFLCTARHHSHYRCLSSL
jgi:hypothetical protein